jgi:outer membrane protein insertion porin family
MIGDGSFNEIKRSGRGLAVEWYSPLGPIQLIFAKAANSKDGDRTSNFEFTIGSRF